MADTAKQTLGFIGVGSQGAPIAARMLAAGDVLVWARRPEATTELVSKGAKAVGTLKDLGSACDYVGVCVVDDTGLKDVCGRLLLVMKPGSVLVVHSTVLPQTCEELERQCKARSIMLVDAPVSGGAPAAEAGTLTVMCGADEAAFQAAKPVLGTFGNPVVLLGPAGAGQRAKIINNALLAANMGLAHQAFAMADKLGVDRQALAELVRESSGRSFGFEVYARLPTPQAFAHGGKLLFKDVNLLLSILGDTPEDNPLGQAALPFLKLAGADCGE